MVNPDVGLVEGAIADCLASAQFSDFTNDINYYEGLIQRLERTQDAYYAAVAAYGAGAVAAIVALPFLTTLTVTSAGAAGGAGTGFAVSIGPAGGAGAVISTGAGGIASGTLGGLFAFGGAAGVLTGTVGSALAAVVGAGALAVLSGVGGRLADFFGDTVGLVRETLALLAGAKSLLDEAQTLTYIPGTARARPGAPLRTTDVPPLGFGLPNFGGYANWVRSTLLREVEGQFEEYRTNWTRYCEQTVLSRQAEIEASEGIDPARRYQRPDLVNNARTGCTEAGYRLIVLAPGPPAEVTCVPIVIDDITAPTSVPSDRGAGLTPQGEATLATPEAPTILQGDFRVQPTRFVGYPGQTATSSVTPQVAPTNAVSLTARFVEGDGTGWTTAEPQWATGETASKNLTITAPQGAAIGNYRVRVTASGGNYDAQTFDIVIALRTRPQDVAVDPSDTTTEAPPTAPTITPCPEPQERLDNGECADPCVPPAVRDPATNLCVAPPTPDATCPFGNTASSVLPRDLTAEEVTALTSTGDYERSFSGTGNRRMTERVRQQRAQSGIHMGTCVTVWPATLHLDGYDVDRDAFGIQRWTAVPDEPITPVVPEPEEVECEGGTTWNEARGECVPDAETPVDRVEVPGLSATGAWLLFLENGSFIEINLFGAGGDGVAFRDEELWYSWRTERGSTSEEVDALADAGPDDLSDATRTTRQSPIISQGVWLAPSAAVTSPGNPLDGNGRLTHAPRGFEVEVYRKADNTILPQSIDPAQNLVVTIIPNLLEPSRPNIRITRDDHTIQVISPSPDGIAWNVRGIEALVRTFTEGPQTTIELVRSRNLAVGGTYYNDLGQESQAAVTAAREAYGGLEAAYHRNSVRLPEFRWGLVDGIEAGLRVLRTHEGRSVHPYRRFRMRFPGTNDRDALAAIRTGTWIEYAVEHYGHRYDVVARIERVRFIDRIDGDPYYEVEGVVDPSVAAALPQALRVLRPSTETYAGGSPSTDDYAGPPLGTSTYG